jgi:DNA-binding PadR family transcriptional regulator
MVLFGLVLDELANPADEAATAGGRTVAQAARVPDTAFGVLGMLTFGESSGYDLAKAIDGSIGFFWAPAKSQLYAELRRLVELGWATEREVEQTDRPDKRLYRVTPEGERVLRDWLDSDPPGIEQIKSPFLLRLFFSDLSGPETTRRLVREHRRQLEGLLAVFRDIERELADAGDERDLTLTYGLAFVRSAIRWCDRTGRELERDGRTDRKAAAR